VSRPLDAANRFDLVQSLATWHGWMGRGLRAEVLLRMLGEPGSALLQSPSARVRWNMTLALCHSCSTGNPQRSIQAAHRLWPVPAHARQRARRPHCWMNCRCRATRSPWRKTRKA
jgi:hypothetical protein